MVFISYAREDLPAAVRLYSDLQTAGVEPWLRAWMGVKSLILTCSIVSKSKPPAIGILEKEKSVIFPATGTPQGGVVVDDVLVRNEQY